MTSFLRGGDVSSNTVQDTTLEGISNDWYEAGWKGHFQDLNVSWNRVTNSLTASGAHDRGAIYMAGANKGNNRIHHNFVNGLNNWNRNVNSYGIYVDVFSSFVHIYRNSLKGMPWAEENDPERYLRGWLTFQVSEFNFVFNNWFDTGYWWDVILNLGNVVDANVIANNYLLKNFFLANYYVPDHTNGGVDLRPWHQFFSFFLPTGYYDELYMSNVAGNYGEHKGVMEMASYIWVDNQ